MSSDKEDYMITGEPSGFTLNVSDRADCVFSDISLISRSEVNFIAKGIRYGKWFAIKGLNELYRTNEACLSMLRKEFELLLQIHHPNVCQVFSIETIPDYGLCIVMEYVDGKELQRWLQSKPSLKDRLRVSGEIADAIDYIHSNEIVHRDLKPENIIITHIGGRPKLIDFGLSDSHSFAVLKQPAGTVSYIAPEQISSSVPDGRNDIYSLGMILKLLLPEKRFKETIASCLKEAASRPEKAQQVQQRLLRDNKRSQSKPWIYAGCLIIILLVAGFIFYPSNDAATGKDISQQNLVSENIKQDFEASNAEVNLTPTEKPSVTSLVGPPTISSENNPSSQNNDMVISPEEITAKNPAKKPDETQEKISIKPKTEVTENKQEKSPSKKISKQASIDYLYKYGQALLEQIWETTALTFLKSVDDINNIPDRWDLTALQNGKEGIIESFEYNLNFTPAFAEKYDITVDDIKDIDRRLNKDIQNYQQKWQELRKKKISKL